MPSDLPPCPVCGGEMTRGAIAKTCGPVVTEWWWCVCGYQTGTIDSHRALCARLARGEAALAWLRANQYGGYRGGCIGCGWPKGGCAPGCEVARMLRTE